MPYALPFFEASLELKARLYVAFSETGRMQKRAASWMTLQSLKRNSERLMLSPRDSQKVCCAIGASKEANACRADLNVR